MKRFGIPLREGNKTRAQLRYGEAWRKRAVAAHHRELANIEKMRKLREEGFSYWKIAAVFNSLGIQTKTGRGRWHARAIQKVLDSVDTKQHTTLENPYQARWFFISRAALFTSRTLRLYL